MISLSTAVRTAALATLLILVPPAAARAASYTVRSCSNGSRSGWSGFPPASVSSSCGMTGGALHARVEGGPQEPAAWRFSAPPDTEIEGFSVRRGYWRNGGVAFGTPVYQLRTFGVGGGYFVGSGNFGPVAVGTAPAIEQATGLAGQTELEVAIVCGGGGWCLHPAASLDIYSAALELRDGFAPSIEHVSGSLLADGAVSGLRTLRYTAADRGGGVARAELRLDGDLVAEQAPDTNGGDCVAVQGEFATVVPCRARASNTLTLDTRSFADGAHQLSLRVIDATAVNHGDASARIEIDNVPPPANRAPPAIAGDARAGGTLTASPGEWSATAPSFAYRWQRYDGGWADVAGATSRAFVAQTEDVGHRLRVRVTATDAEGSGVAYSESTARVLAAPADADAGGSDAGPGAPGAPAAAVPPAPPAPGAASRLEIEAWLGRERSRTVTVAYGRAVAVRGTVHDASGAPAGGVPVSLLAAVDGRWRAAGTTATGPNGRFSMVAGAGPSRRLVIAAGAARSRPLQLAVRAAVELRAARQGRWTVLRGALRGGHVPPGGVLVTVEARRGRRWVALTTLASDRRGRFHGRVAGAPRLRAAVARQPGYPFAAGASR